LGLKDILVHVGRTEDSLGRLRLAIDLASRHQARVVALYAWELSDEQLEERRTADMGLASGAAYDRMMRREEAQIDEDAKSTRSVVEALGHQRGVEIEWRCVTGRISDLLGQHARYSDLCVVGHRSAVSTARSDYTLSEKLLFVTGGPVLFIPPGEALATLGHHVAVGWNSSRAAARALNDAMPLIERADRTTILAVNADEYIDQNGGLPTEWLVSRLSRHGAKCEVIRIESIPAPSIAGELQDQARKLGADMLVTGAFGHPKLWEKLFGGVTRGLLDRMTMPTLMSN
jgi:nucleotide-binding universal stress UspA family protein